jgi:hypothetical protein
VGLGGLKANENVIVAPGVRREMGEVIVLWRGIIKNMLLEFFQYFRDGGTAG